MRKEELGQALILVLVILAIGAILVVPLLRLAYTGLKGSDIVTSRTVGLYAVDGAQEYIMWKLLHQDWAQQFTEDGQEGYLEIINCGTNVTATIVMRAIPGEGGMTLATDDVILPTKSVEPNSAPLKGLYEYEYTITLDHLSSNTTQGLDAIYDVLPGGITDYIGPSELSLDDGETWQNVPDPLWDSAKGYLKWPADYEWDPVVTGAFSSHPEFLGIQDFGVREVKKLRFRVRARFDNDQVHCNWVVLKPWNTVSGPQAPITVGDPDEPGVCVDDNVIEIAKAADPNVITPGVPTLIRYDLDITNNYTQTRNIEGIIDYLPPEFFYMGPTANLTDQDPQGTEHTVTINGIDRYKLEWTQVEFGYPGPPKDISIAAGQTLRLTFYVQATKDVSGSYYNEVSVILRDTGISAAFAAAGVTPGEYAGNYSWNQGSVTVPTFDARTEGEGVVIDSNLSMVVGGISITSLHLR